MIILHVWVGGKEWNVTIPPPPTIDHRILVFCTPSVPVTLNWTKMTKLKRLVCCCVYQSFHWHVSSTLDTSIILQCLVRAIALKDKEGTALIRLAKWVAIRMILIHLTCAWLVFLMHRLHAKLGEEDEAANLYNRFIAKAESSEVRLLHAWDKSDVSAILNL